MRVHDAIDDKDDFFQPTDIGNYKSNDPMLNYMMENNDYGQDDNLNRTFKSQISACQSEFLTSMRQSMR